MIDEDQSRYEKSLELYKKALDIANQSGSSVKVILTQRYWRFICNVRSKF